MKKIQLPWAAWYGDKIISLPVPRNWQIKKIGIKKYENPSLKNLLQQMRLFELEKNLKSKQPKTIAIVIDDLTRPTPAELIIKTIIELLIKLNYGSDQIHIYPAIGAHRPLQLQDLKKKIGAFAIKNSTIHHHSIHYGNKKVGQTKNGLSIEINKSFINKEFKIVIGTVLPHSSVGFSGGFKLVMPGLASFKTIKGFHQLPKNYKRTRNIANNFLRQRIDEAKKFMPIDFSLQIVCNPDRTIAKIFSGKLDSSYEKTIKFLAKKSKVKIIKNADIAIFNCYPLDIEFIQSGKSLDIMRDSNNLAVNKNGTIVVCTAASEGEGYHQLRSPDMIRPFNDDWTKPYENRELIFYGPNITQQMIPTPTRNKVKVFQHWDKMIKYLAKKHPTPKVTIYQTASVQITK